jgi:hypothetical protein
MTTKNTETGDGGTTSMAIGTVADPVLSADGTFFYFTWLNSGSNGSLAEVFEAYVGQPFPKARVVTDPAVAPVSGKLRRPTGLSSDLLTLFFWDESDGQEHEAFRSNLHDQPGNVWGGCSNPVLALGSRQNAVPNAACTRIYFADGVTGLASAPRN